jgi:hypothetical protein
MVSIFGFLDYIVENGEHKGYGYYAMTFGAIHIATNGTAYTAR